MIQGHWPPQLRRAPSASQLRAFCRPLARFLPRGRAVREISGAGTSGSASVESVIVRSQICVGWRMRRDQWNERLQVRTKH